MSVGDFGFVGTPVTNSGTGTSASISLPANLQIGDTVAIHVWHTDTAFLQTISPALFNNTYKSDHYDTIFDLTPAPDLDLDSYSFLWTQELLDAGDWDPIIFTFSVSTPWYAVAFRIENIGFKDSPQTTTTFGIGSSGLVTQFDADLFALAKNYNGGAPYTDIDQFYAQGAVVGFYFCYTRVGGTTAAQSLTVTGLNGTSIQVGGSWYDATLDAAFTSFVVEAASMTDIIEVRATLTEPNQVYFMGYFFRPAAPQVTFQGTSLVSTTGTTATVRWDCNYTNGLMYAAAYAVHSENIHNARTFNVFDSYVLDIKDALTRSPFFAVSAASAPLTGGTVDVTLTGLEADQHYHIYMVPIAYGKYPQEIGFINDGDPINSSGNVLDSTVFALRYVDTFSGTNASSVNVTINQQGIQPGDMVYITTNYGNTGTLTVPDPDGIVFDQFDSLTGDGASMRQVISRIDGWLNNGNYNSLTLTFGTTPTNYTGTIVCLTSGNLTTASSGDTNISNESSATLGAFFGGPLSTQTYWLLLSSQYNRSRGLMNPYPPRKIGTVFANAAGFGPQMTSEAGNEYLTTYYTFQRDAPSQTWELIFDITITTDPRNAYSYFLAETPVINNPVFTPGIDTMTATFNTIHSLGRLRFLVTTEDLSALSGQDLYEAANPTEGGSTFTYCKNTTNLEQSIVVTGLLEKTQYNVYVVCYSYGMYATASDVITTVDGPDEIVYGVTEVLSFGVNPSTVTAVYNAPTITAVLPDVWQDGLADIIINTTNITTHQYTRVWVEGTEQIVTGVAKNQLTITAEQGILADGAYPVTLTDYVPNGFSTWTQPPLSALSTDPFAANVSFALSGTNQAVSGSTTRVLTWPTDFYSAGIANPDTPVFSPRLYGEVREQEGYLSPVGTRVFYAELFGSGSTPYGVGYLPSFVRPDASLTGTYQCDQPFTIEGWFNFGPATRTAVFNFPLIDFEDVISSTYTGFSLYAVRATISYAPVIPGYDECRKLAFFALSQTSSSTLNSVWTTAVDELLVPEKWYHIALSYFPDAQLFNIWVNGKLRLATTTLNNAPLLLSDVFDQYIGGNALRPEYLWDNPRITFGVERYTRSVDFTSQWWGPYL